MQRSIAKRLWYQGLRLVLFLLASIALRLRVFGHDRLPASGGVLLVSNHQSHLDPVLIGIACRRRLNFLARSSLFRIRFLALLLHSLDTIPIEREGSGLGGLKETLRRLRRDEMVLVFPEGTRTGDGEVAPLRGGFAMVAQRARVPIVPLALDGGFACWPRWQRFPAAARVSIEFGEPILPDEYRQLDDQQLGQRVHKAICTAHRRARRRLALARSAFSLGRHRELAAESAGDDVEKSSSKALKLVKQA